MTHNWITTAFQPGVPASARQAIIDEQVKLVPDRLIIHDHDFRGANFCGLDLGKVQLHDCVLTGASIAGAIVGALVSCTIEDMLISDTLIKSMLDSNVYSCIIERCMVGPVFADNRIYDTEVRHTRLADQYGARTPGPNSFVRVHFCALSAVDSDCTDSHFTESSFTKCRITRSNLVHCEFADCSMNDVNLTGSRLPERTSMPTLNQCCLEHSSPSMRERCDQLYALLTQLHPEIRYTANAVSEDICYSESLLVYLDAEQRYRIHAFDAGSGAHLRLYGVGDLSEIENALPFLVMDYRGWRFRDAMSRRSECGEPVIGTEIDESGEAGAWKKIVKLVSDEMI